MPFHAEEECLPANTKNQNPNSSGNIPCNEDHASRPIANGIPSKREKAQLQLARASFRNVDNVFHKCKLVIAPASG